MLCGPDQSAGLLLSFCSSVPHPHSSFHTHSILPSHSLSFAVSAPNLLMPLNSSLGIRRFYQIFLLLLGHFHLLPTPEFLLFSLSTHFGHLRNGLHPSYLLRVTSSLCLSLSLIVPVSLSLCVRDCVHSVAQLSPNSP